MRKTVFVLCFICSSFSYANHVKYIVENNTLFSCNVGKKISDSSFKSGREYWFNENIRAVLQQSINSPNSVVQREGLSMKRYTYWRGIEIGKQLFTKPISPWSNYLSLDIGTLGLNGHIDGVALRQLEEKLQRQNIGAIETRLQHEICANVQWWTKYNWNINEFISITPRYGLLAGTLVDATEIGCTTKIGWNVSRYKDAANGNNILSIDEGRKVAFFENIVICGFTGVSCRYYLYNHFLQGSLIRNRINSYDIYNNPLVGDITFGTHIEAYGIFIVWYGTIRTQEYDTQESALNFGGLNVGYRHDF